MYTVEQIANEINKLKPDFTEFKKYLQLQEQKNIQNDIDNTGNIFVKLFKAQLLLVMNKTHARYYIDANEYQKLLFTHVSDSGILSGRNYNNSVYYYIPHSYYIKDKFQLDQIAYYVTDIQNYLPKYLWDKVRSKTIQEFKTLQPDGFALITFKNYLAGLKKELSSTQAIEYLHQIKSFDPNIKQQYIEVLSDHLTQPSIKFQDTLVGILPSINYNKGLVKFMSLNRWYIKDVVREYKLLVPESVLDSLDSSYKPFITGIKRKPSTDIHDLSALVGTLLILRVAVSKYPNEINSYFIEQITEHLKHPDYKVPLEEYIKTLELTKLSIEETINGFI